MTGKEQIVARSNEIESILNGLTTTSAKMRALHDSGFSRMAIAQILDKRYQHVKNVLDMYVLKGK